MNTGHDYDKPAKFEIGGCIPQGGIIGEVGRTFTPEAFNVELAPIVWNIETFGGEVANATIDPATGEVTYDLVDVLVNGGNGHIVVSATDQCGQRVSHVFCVKMQDPVSVITLACNADINRYEEAIAAKFIFNGLVNDDAVFQDLAKTVLSEDGDPVSVWEDGNGNGDVTVRPGNNPPTLVVGGSPRGNNALNFVSANSESLQYDVPGAPAPGSAFKVFFLARLTADAGGNATVISSTTVAQNNATGTGTWQFSRSSGGPQFVARWGQGYNLISGTPSVTAGATDVELAPWTTFSDGNWHLIYLDFDGTVATGFFDGQQVFEVEPLVPPVAEHFKFGENRAGADYINLQLAEFHYANNTMSDEEATKVQAYYLCKFGLDASLISDPGPFAIVEDACYTDLSQFELQTLTDGSEVVYDTRNNVYYDKNDVPTPGIAYFCDPLIAYILSQIDVVSGEGSDDQQVSLSGNVLTLEDGGSVDLSGFLDTDDQEITALSITPAGIMNIQIEGDTVRTLDLTQLLDNTDQQQLTLVGNTLTLQNGGTVNLSGYLDDTDTDTDQQQLTRVGNTLILENGGMVDLTDLLDDTDDQTLSVAGTLLSISGGNNVNLSAFLDNTDEQQLIPVYDGDGVLQAIEISNGNTINVTHPTLTTTTEPIYEHRDIWAEESAGTTDNSAQWSFGNGATGFIGLPIDDGWEVESMYLHADATSSATADLTVALVDFTTPSTAAAVIAQVAALDNGQGVQNNMYQFTDFTQAPNTPQPVPTGAVLGFRTVDEVGTISDARVGARLRRKVADVITSVSLA